MLSMSGPVYGPYLRSVYFFSLNPVTFNPPGILIDLILLSSGHPST